VPDDTDGVADFKKEVDEGFDQALAEVAAAVAAVPVPMALPGLEPTSDADTYSAHVPIAPEAPLKTPTLRDQLRLKLGREEREEGGDDPITAFAPEAELDWGPRRLKLTGRGDEDEPDDD
jgi:hypothetical protein